MAALGAAAVIVLAVPMKQLPASTEGSGAVGVTPDQATSALIPGLQSVPGGALIPSRLLEAAGEAAAGPMSAPGSGLGYATVPYASPISFTIHQDGLSIQAETSEATIGQALTTAGIKVGKNDLVTPSLNSPLTQGMHVYLSSAKMVRVMFEGGERLIYTRSGTVAGLLAELGIAPQPGDRIFPGLDDPVRRGMSVSLVTFRDGAEFSEDPVGYETLYQDDPNMLKGQRRVEQAGIEGYVRREFKITRLNGQELGRDLVNEISVAPTNEVIAVGTRIPATPAPVVRAPSVSFEGMSCVGSMNVYATWYTAASAGGGGVTATGTGVYKGIIAVDPRVIPLGTRMYIPGYGYGLAADTGGAIKGSMIDLGYGADDALDWHPRYTDICILG